LALREEATEIAKKHGWIHEDGQDYCPECASKIGIRKDT
jgi:hypothetical protein